MAPKKTATPRFVEPEDESQDPEDQMRLEATEPDEEPEPEPAGGSISKAAAIRAALDAGKEKPEEGTAFILDRFGLEVSKQHFSSSKSQMRSKEAAKPAKPAKAAPQARKAVERPVEDYQLPPQRPAGGEGDLLDAMERLKPIVASMGAERVKRLADLLG